MERITVAKIASMPKKTETTDKYKQGFVHLGADSHGTHVCTNHERESREQKPEKQDRYPKRVRRLVVDVRESLNLVVDYPVSLFPSYSEGLDIVVFGDVVVIAPVFSGIGSSHR